MKVHNNVVSIMDRFNVLIPIIAVSTTESQRKRSSDSAEDREQRRELLVTIIISGSAMITAL